MANGDDKTHASSTVWDRLDQHGRSISELVATQAATQANLDALARTMQSGFEQVNGALGRVADDLRTQQERDSKPTNWYAVLSGIVLVGGALLAFVALQTDPVRIRAMELSGQMDQIMERELEYAKYHGYSTAQDEYIIKRLDRLEDFQHDALRDLGRFDELRQRVEDIDNRGSRRWNDAGSPRE